MWWKVQTVEVRRSIMVCGCLAERARILVRSSMGRRGKGWKVGGAIVAVRMYVLLLERCKELEHAEKPPIIHEAVVQ